MGKPGAETYHRRKGATQTAQGASVHVCNRGSILGNGLDGLTRTTKGANTMTFWHILIELFFVGIIVLGVVVFIDTVKQAIREEQDDD